MATAFLGIAIGLGLVFMPAFRKVCGFLALAGVVVLMIMSVDADQTQRAVDVEYDYLKITQTRDWDTATGTYGPARWVSVGCYTTQKACHKDKQRGLCWKIDPAKLKCP